MRKLLTTLLPLLNYLKQSNLHKNNLLPSYYYLLPCEYKSFLHIRFMQIVTFMYNVLSMYQFYCS